MATRVAGLFTKLSNGESRIVSVIVFFCVCVCVCVCFVRLACILYLYSSYYSMYVIVFQLKGVKPKVRS